MKLKQMAQMKWGEIEGEERRGGERGGGAGGAATGAVAVAVAEAGQSLLCADNDNTK